MKKLALALILFASPLAHAHTEYELLTPDGELYPGCGVEPESRPAECPFRLRIEGWDVYVSSLILTDEYADGFFSDVFNRIDTPTEKVIAFLDKFSLQLQLLEERPFPAYFAWWLKEQGVSFYIVPVEKFVDESGYDNVRVPENEPFSFCRWECYSAGRRAIQLNMDDFSGSMRTLVHELAHAWHHLIVPDGYNNKCIEDAYEFSVVRDRIYYDVPLIATLIGYQFEANVMEESAQRLRNVYASVNPREYFAELVENYLLGSVFSNEGATGLPYSDRFGMYEVDRNGYFMIKALVSHTGNSFTSMNCDRPSVLPFGQTFWPQ